MAAATEENMPECGNAHMYRQDVKGGTTTDVRGLATEARGQRRDLKSDVLLVRAPAGDRWLQFRDVFEVDGKPVRDRVERLAKLFLQPPADAQSQVDSITTESARYNIGGVNRNVNLPTLVLAALEPENRAWFTFIGSRKKDSPAGPTWELVPREMREKYVTKSGLTVEGRATYSNYRRYKVTVEEKVK